jgi:predicted ATPase
MVGRDLERGPGAERFFVLTGGPGAGKSTLIDQLRGAGFTAMPEAGRSIIREQAAISGPALPWVDPVLYAETILSWDIRSYRMAEQTAGPVFFDRGVTDAVAAFGQLALPVPGHVHDAALTYRYSPLVFIAPPWPEIYAQDTERKQSLEEAERTHDALASTYPRYGYELVSLPRASVLERVRFVLETVGLG